jgi:hypothetical protein
MWVHAYNPSYLGGGDQEAIPGHSRPFQGQPKWEKLVRPPSQKISQGWWLTTVIQAMQEAEVGGSQLEAIIKQKARSYLKNN